MTDKEFDKLLKDSLLSDEVPSSLNTALLKKVQKKRHSAKIYNFVKFGSAVAAMFVCAIAVLSYFNSDTNTHMKQDAEAPRAVNSSGDTVSAPETAETSLSPSTSVKQAEIDVAKVSQNTAEATAADTLPENPPQMRSELSLRDTQPSLEEMFNEGYDYKTVISEKIKEQIKELPNASEYNFSSISDDISFTVSDENMLTIVFAEGEIISSEHGEQYFTVGTVANGVLN